MNDRNAVRCRVLLLASGFNGLTQRFYTELTDAGHEVAVEIHTGDATTLSAVEAFRPDVIFAPFLTRAVAEEVWGAWRCIIVHPGVKGDRGPSSLDWAIQEGEAEWGVTLLEAVAEMDAGPIWATRIFPLRADATKSSVYGREVTESAVACLWEVMARLDDPGFAPEPLDYARPDVRGRLRPAMKQADRRIDWAVHTTAEVLHRIRAADGAPGVADLVRGAPVMLHDAWPEPELRGAPGEIVARYRGAVCRATVDGAVWIGHLRPRPAGGGRGIKLPATTILGPLIDDVPELAPGASIPAELDAFGVVRYEEEGDVGVLHFPFVNGAMSTAQCRELLLAYRCARARPTRAIVLAGGPGAFSNGIHLNRIEAAADPAAESWANINAIDDLVRAILTTDDKLTVTTFGANAGAGGVVLGAAADLVLARDGVVLNPHYQTMGGLYGSEYWTYVLPLRCGDAVAAELTSACLPIGAARAAALGLVDAVLPSDRAAFARTAAAEVRRRVADPDFGPWLAAKAARRRADEAARPLAAYREVELAEMRRNFFGPDRAYHDARRAFVLKERPVGTPPHLARLGRPGVATPGVDRRTPFAA